jgi:plastocyanin
MTISVQTRSEVTTMESISLGPGDSQTYQHVGMNTTVSGLGAASTPPAAKLAAFATTLASGTATIDLTAVPDSYGASQTLTGLRVQIIKVQAPATNVNPIALTPGSYAAAGGGFVFHSGGSITLNPGDEVLWTNTSGTSAPAVSGSVKTLTLTGTGSADKLNFTIVAG